LCYVEESETGLEADVDEQAVRGGLDAGLDGRVCEIVTFQVRSNGCLLADSRTALQIIELLLDISLKLAELRVQARSEACHWEYNIEKTKCNRE
jgi:hypothetical protein